jgi:hypothetical protein
MRATYRRVGGTGAHRLRNRAHAVSRASKTKGRGADRQIGIGAGSLLAPGLIESEILLLLHENRRSGALPI